jgi:hypothetical protein
MTTSVLESRYQHLLQTVMAARACDLDGLIGQVWAAYGEGRLAEAEAQQLDDAARARRTVLVDRRRDGARAHHLARQKRINGMRPLVQVGRDAERRRRSLCENRIKTFGMGRPKPMSTRTKRRLMDKARGMTRPTEPGKHYGVLTPKFVAVLEALLVKFHNAVSGLCFPSYDALAEAADCARSTVGKALIALEEAELLSWDHRIKRVFETVIDLFGAVVRGQRSQVQRTSNGYTFFFDNNDDAKSSKSDLTSGTRNPFIKKDSSLATAMPATRLPAPKPVDSVLDTALMRLGSAIRTGAGRA